MHLRELKFIVVSKVNLLMIVSQKQRMNYQNIKR